MYQEKIIDIETGKITMRDYTSEEIAEVEAAIAKAKEAQEDEIAKQNEKRAVLEKLGITAEQAKLFLS